MASWVVIGAGIILGIGNAVHCLGMCGPLALSVPLPRTGNWPERGLLLGNYHLWRLVAYFLLTSLVLLIGQQTSALLPFIKHQQTLTLIMVASLGLMMIVPIVGQYAERGAMLGLNKPLKWLMRIYHSVKHTSPALSTMILGLMHGIVPCGLVYAAIILATVSGDYLHAISFMLGFGLTTSAVLTTFVLLGRPLLPKFNLTAVRVMLLFVSAFLIWRVQKQIIVPSHDGKPAAIECHSGAQALKQ